MGAAGVGGRIDDWSIWDGSRVYTVCHCLGVRIFWECGSMNAGRMVCNARWHHTKVIMWCSEERGWGCIISNNKLHKQTISQGHSDLQMNGKSGSGDQGGAAGC